MKKFNLFIWLNVLPFLSYGMESKINMLIRQADPAFSIGVAVETLEGKVLFLYNAEKSFISASTQKILPAALGLGVSKNPSLIPGLPSSFKRTPFVTEVLYDAQKDTTYLVFGGDPLLNLKDLEHIFQTAKERGLMGKTLYVVMDNQTEGPSLPAINPGCPYEGIDFCYGGILSTAVVNQNRVSFDFSGASKTGKAHIALDPGQPSFVIENMTHVQETCFKDEAVGQWDQVQRSALEFDGKKITVKGCVPRTFEAKMCLPVQPYAMRDYTQAFVEDALKHNHLKAKIVFIDQVAHTKGFKRFIYSSSTLEKLLPLILKDSNNLVTDALFAKLTHRSSWPRNWDFAGRVLKDHMERIFGVVFSKEDKINSGSGLSLYNRLTPLTLTHVLRKAHAHLGEEFVEFLAQAGIDGTLQDRLKALPACTKISGKTGHLHGATSFGGYVQKNGKDPYVVSIFIEGDSEKAKERRELLDNILMAVLESQ